MLAGIAVLADWLGSDSALFCYCDQPLPLFEYWEKYALPTAREAVKAAGILPPPVQCIEQPRELFDYLEMPTPLQQACLDLPIGTEPQLFILEDVSVPHTRGDEPAISLRTSEKAKCVPHTRGDEPHRPVHRLIIEECSPHPWG